MNTNCQFARGAEASTRSLLVLAMLALAAIPGAALAQDIEQILSEYGPVFDVPDPGFPTPMDQDLRAVFEISDTPEDVEALNRALVTPARFLRMHARLGIPAERLDVVLVIHGGAAMDLLNNDEYRARHGVDNPSAALLEALQSAGARVVLCGQTAAYRELRPDMLVPGVDLALSAMTAIVALQSQGYALVAW